MPDSTPARVAVPQSHLLGLFLLSAGLLLFEIALTKIFSIILWYHFGFLVISFALLGFAISGVWLARVPERIERGASFLARLAGAAALSTALALWLVVHTQVDAFSLIADHDEGGLVFQMLVLLVPFFFLGAATSATLTLYRARAGGVYAANLVGSGAGCAAAVVVFDVAHASAPDAVLAAALLMGIAGVLYALSAPRALPLPLAATVLLGAALFGWEGRERGLHLVAPKSKPLWYVEQWDREQRPRSVVLPDGARLVFTGEPRVEGDVVVALTPHGDEVRVAARDLPLAADGTIDVRPASLVEFTRWSSLSRVDGFTWPAGNPAWGLWGLSSAYTGPLPRQKGITIDSWAMTNVLAWEGAPSPPPEVLEYLPASLCHRIRSNASILCIGAGGGMDLLAAVRFGAASIVGVEINAGVVAAAREAFLDFQGGLYDPARTPQVELVVAEGRHFLERDERRWDIVQLSGVDTASTTQAGAFSLSENFLYTEEAFDTYLAHTRAGGLVTLTRWFLPDSAGRPRETLRLFVLAFGALERAGVADPARCIYLVESRGFSVILFGRNPFEAGELATLDDACARLSFRSLYHPTRPSPYLHPATRAPLENRFESFARAPDKAAFLAAYPYDIAAPTDDRPFFFETSRFARLLERDSLFNSLGGITAHGILVILLGMLALAGGFFVLAPLVRQARALASAGPAVATLVYFGSLGFGFILVEVVLAQKFVLYLGSPFYALAVVLFGVLVFSGIGSALSSRVGEPRRALAVVVALAALYPLLLEPIFAATLWLPTAARIAISLTLLAPLATAMGMPFPLGIARIAGHGSSLVSWAWGVNGYTSVVGSALTVMLSLGLGFDVVVWIGAAVYALAWLVRPGLAQRPA